MYLTDTDVIHQNDFIYDYITQISSFTLLVIGDFKLINLNINKCEIFFEITKTKD